MSRKKKRKQEKSVQEKVKRDNLFYRIAMFLYKQACIKGLPLFSSRQVESDLAQLHPGENIQWLRTEYYVRKLSLTMTILAAGLLFGGVARISAAGQVVLREDGSIPRSSYLEGEKELRVSAQLDGDIQKFEVMLRPQELSVGELDELAAKFMQHLPELIKGKNESLQMVTEDLELSEFYEGYPFRVDWKTSRPDVLGSSGSVSRPREQVQVELQVEFYCQNQSWEETVDALVLPPVLTPKEQLHLDLEEYLTASEEESRKEEAWMLPDSWQGSEISWTQSVEDNSLLLWAAGLAVAVLTYVMSDRDLHQQLEIRKKALQQEYPDIVHQLVLFVGAGMTVRGAFQKVAADYEKKQEKFSKRLPAYEEMIYTCRELQAGVSEGAAYEHFGRRTGRQEYIRLSTLLMQNLKRGNSTLLERLREEADKAGEERLMHSRRLGEEAGTKLLVPMVLMLAVVMVMIMVPAFSTM